MPRGKPEARISGQIQKFLRLVGLDVASTEQGYRRAPGGTRMTPGIPDLYVRGRVWGVPVRFWVEVKVPKKNPTPKQQAWHETERAAGGDVYVWRSIEDAKNWYEQARAKAKARLELDDTNEGAL